MNILRQLVLRFFDIRKGELNISLFMFLYIFIVIAVLLIVKPTVNALFLSELGAEQLPFGFVLVALGAVISSHVYSRLQYRYKLKGLIALSVVLSAILLLLLSLLLFTGYLKTWALYFFYTWVAIYGVLAASQFWVLANLIFNNRDAKRLFGFIGSGAILGGLLGGYLTSLLAPYVGNGFMILLSSISLLLLLPILNRIWKHRQHKSKETRKLHKNSKARSNPYKLIKNSKHLTNLAILVGISVLVAKLADYLFSDYAASAISDPDELSSFFGFWFSTFNLVALGIQLLLTHRIVGIWGVGFSLMLLPIGIAMGSVFFLFLPELSVVVAIKAIDGVLKQSINKSAFELLALPISFEIKNRTKSFIDVVVDSFATGIAGLLLVFFIKGFEWESYEVIWLILVLVIIWIVLIFRVRSSYYEMFRNNLKGVSEDQDLVSKKSSPNVIEGMRTVFKTGSEKQILFMLDKLMEINDKRFTVDVRNLLEHPSNKVKTAAIRNLYFLDSHIMPSNCNDLLKIGDDELTLSVLNFLLLHARNEPDEVYSYYLEHSDPSIASAALFSLARESGQNISLRQRYYFNERLERQIQNTNGLPSPLLLQTIGVSGYTKYYDLIRQSFRSEDLQIRRVAIQSMGLSKDEFFLPDLLDNLVVKDLRPEIILAIKNYGDGILPLLARYARDRVVNIENCLFIPRVLESFGNQEAVFYLFKLFDDVDLSIRQEVVRSLSNMRTSNPQLAFNRFKVISRIFDECKLYHQTVGAMHTQIIISYRNRKKSRKEVRQDERDARASLLDLLERRLDAGLERIFKLLGLKFPYDDIILAYTRLNSGEEDDRSIAIDFLDNLLTGNLKKRLFPIIEEKNTDFTNEEAVIMLKPKIPTEQECFKLLLQIPDLKLKLAVLYLIGKQGDKKYTPLLQELSTDKDPKISTFALEALRQLQF